MLAAQKGDVKVAGVLIDGGADILIEDYVSNFIHLDSK